MLKLIYLAKRRPGFSADAFTRRWRMHGAKGMAADMWRHSLAYVQCEPIRPAPLPGASDAHDAVTCWHVADDAFADITPADAADGQAMLADELETFAAPIHTVSLWVEEERLKPGALGGITAFLFFADAAAAREAATHYAAAAQPHRVVLNLRAGEGAAVPMPSALPYAAVVEVAASGLPELKAALEEGGAPFSRADLTVVTREAVLWDRLAAA